jgi:hypothetical protein
MLKSVDVLIGLVVILLALSMAVTVITQSVTAIVNSRGSHLRRGLMDLLKLIDPKLPADACHTIVTAVLKHPLVSGSDAFGVMRLGNVVHREEFTKLLLGLASADSDVELDAEAKKQLTDALKRNGIDDPTKVLKDIRTEALALEQSHPDLAHSARQSLAIVRKAQSDFTAKIHNWFDQSIDRTAQRFTASTRVITFAGGLIVALVLQVNTLSVANRLAADDRLREAFVNRAVKSVAVDTNSAIDQQYRAFLVENGIIRFPTSSKEWVDGFTWTNLTGMFVTALLLSLGAPFWYNMLGKLLQLRSVLAFKDDAQREDRQDERTPAIKETQSPRATAATA